MHRFILIILLAGSFGRLTANNLVVRAVIPGILLNENLLPVADRPLADTLPPIVECPPNVTLTLQSSNCDTVYTYTVTVEDDQPGVVGGLVSGIHSGDPFPVGTTINVFIAIDASGNTASCSFSVKVTPPAGSAISCEDLVLVKLGADCNATLAPQDFLIPPFDCPDVYLAEVDRTTPFGNGPWLPAVFDVADLGKTYQARITDTRTQNKCWGNVKIVDSLPPVLVCPEITVPCTLPTAHLEPAFLKDSLGILVGEPDIMDNCTGFASLVISLIDESADLPCDSPGTITGYIHRTWMARDLSGNTATCLQVINRNSSLADVHFPADTAVSCAQPGTLPARTGSPYAQVGSRKYSYLMAPDCQLDVFYFDSIETLCGGGRMIHREWIAQDPCLPKSSSNPVTHFQKIAVPDLDTPMLHCPLDTVLTGPATNCGILLNLPDVIASDFCSKVSNITAFWTLNDLTQSLDGTLQNFAGNVPGISDTLAVLGEVPDFPVGLTTVLYVVSDVCGNTASCEFVLELRDTTPPVAVCDSLLAINLGVQGQYMLPAEALSAGSTDDCGALHFKVRRKDAGECSLTDTSFDDQMLFCCADRGDTIPVTLRVFDVVTPPGFAADSFALGHFSDCSALVTVLDTLPPGCALPATVTVECANFDPTLHAYGNAALSCKVDSMAQIADYSAFDTTCSKGIVTRIIQVFDKNGNSGQCSQQIEVTGTQNYWIKFPDDIVDFTCVSAGNYGQPSFGNRTCENLKASFQDEIFTVVPDACYKIERTWTIINTCSFDSTAQLIEIPNPSPNGVVNHPANLPGPIVAPAGNAAPWAPTVVALAPGKTPTNYSKYWAAGANGYKYKQIIKVVDSQDPVIDACPTGPVSLNDETGNDSLFWNAAYWWDPAGSSHDLSEGPADLCISASDLCFGPDVDIRFLLFLDLDGTGVQETAISSTNLPGYNNLYFGNAQNPNYSGGSPRAFDGRPVPDDQKYGFALQITQNGGKKTACVRWNTQQAPNDYVVPQLPYGTHRISWTASDQCGNYKQCGYTFTIGNGVALTGKVQTEANTGVIKTAVSVSGTTPGSPPFNLNTTTDDFGNFKFKVKEQSSYTLTPKRDDDPLNGVSTFDLLLINKHVLGLELLNSPYKIIAADANHSRTVSTFDIVELRKLILGIYSKLPASDSWRFVDKAYTFPEPANPFKETFPETQTVMDFHANALPVHDFIGLKVGDVNGSAIADLQGSDPETRSDETLYLDLQDRPVQAGETFDVPVQLAGPAIGGQFTLSLPGLEIFDLAPGAGLSRDNFGVFNESEALTASWENPSPDIKPGFTLRLRANKAGMLHNMLQLSNRITRSEAYSTSLERMDLALRFDGLTVQQPGLELFQNQPNPFASSTSIGFYLPEAKQATLRIVDATGREWYRQTADYAAGRHALTINREQLGEASGVLFVWLETDTARRGGRMVFMR